MDGMWDLHHLELHHLAGWAYLAIFVVTVADSLFPVVPAETVVITGGVLAAAGELDLAGVLAATIAGAIVGDLITYEVSRRGAHRLIGRWLRRDRFRRMLVWATLALERRGTAVVCAGRFIPLGRTAVSLASGYLHFPRRRFAVALALGGTMWSAYAVGLGYLGGHLAENPVVSVSIGIALGLAVAGIASTAHRMGRRHAPQVGMKTRAPLASGPCAIGRTAQ